MQCDLCGTEEHLVRTAIEGTELNVCRKCSSYGKVLGRPVLSEHGFSRPALPVERIQMIIPDYPSAIRTKRESLGMTQKDFAQRLNEKESIIHKIEIGSYEPSIPLARKLERLLKIRLVDQVEEKHEKTEKQSSNQLTIGDLIKIRQR